MLPLSSARTHQTELPIEAGIPKSWNALVPIVSEAHFDTVCSFLLQHRPKEPVSASGYDTGTYHVTGGPERPEYGSRPRVGLTNRDFEDPGACLCRYTTY